VLLAEEGFTMAVNTVAAVVIGELMISGISAAIINGCTASINSSVESQGEGEGGGECVSDNMEEELFSERGGICGRVPSSTGCIGI
jgi:hypothetical protein